MSDTKKCRRCKQQKPKSDFVNASGEKNPRGHNCSECYFSDRDRSYARGEREMLIVGAFTGGIALLLLLIFDGLDFSLRVFDHRIGVHIRNQNTKAVMFLLNGVFAWGLWSFIYHGLSAIEVSIRISLRKVFQIAMSVSCPLVLNIYFIYKSIELLDSEVSLVMVFGSAITLPVLTVALVLIGFMLFLAHQIRILHGSSPYFPLRGYIILGSSLFVVVFLVRIFENTGTNTFNYSPIRAAEIASEKHLKDAFYFSIQLVRYVFYAIVTYPILYWFYRTIKREAIK